MASFQRSCSSLSRVLRYVHPIIDTAYVEKSPQSITKYYFSSCKITLSRVCALSAEINTPKLCNIDDFVTNVYSRTNCNCKSQNENGRNCWKCGRENDKVKEFFFCVCGVVQEPVKSLTYFRIFDIDESFDVNIEKISSMYKSLQMKLHPDRFSQKSEREQSISELQSSVLNKAYFTLAKPLSRAIYMLELGGVIMEEEDMDVSSELLMEIMEVNEIIADCDSPESLGEVEMENKLKIKQCVTELSEAFQQKDLMKAKSTVIKLKYYDNVHEKIRDIWRRSFG